MNRPALAAPACQKMMAVLLWLLLPWLRRGRRPWRGVTVRRQHHPGEFQILVQPLMS